MRTALAFLAFCFIVPPPALRADGGCATRPPDAVEAKAYKAMAAAFRKAAPPAPAGWSAEDSPAGDRLESVCKESDGYPMRHTFRRKYRRQEGMGDRQKKGMAGTEAVVKKMQATQKGNAAAIAELDRKIAALTKKLEAEAKAQRYDRLEAMSKEMEVLGNQKAKLLGGEEARADMASIQAEADRDTGAEFEAAFNVEGEGVGDFQPVKAAPADLAFRITRDDGGNPVEETVLFFGAWKAVGEDRIAPAGGSLRGKAAAAVHNAVARLRADPARAAGLLKAADLTALKAALGR